MTIRDPAGDQHPVMMGSISLSRRLGSLPVTGFIIFFETSCAAEAVRQPSSVSTDQD